MTQQNQWIKFGIPAAVFNGALYFFVAIAGGANLQHLFHFDGLMWIAIISMGAAFCYGMFTFKTVEFLTLKPTTPLAWCLAILAPFAASSYLTAGIEGAALFNFFNGQVVIGIGILLFLMRCVNYVDGAVKFPVRLRHIKHSWMAAITKQDYKALLCILIVIYTTLGYSLSTTDAIYSATIKLFHLLRIETQYLTFFAYVAACIGAIVGIPMILYWSQRGLSQITNCNKLEINGKLHDHSDIYTYLGLFGSLPVILGSLGGATGSHGDVFGQLGIFSDVVRVTTSALFAVCASVPGVSTLLRHASCLLESRKPMTME